MSDVVEIASKSTYLLTPGLQVECLGVMEIEIGLEGSSLMIMSGSGFITMGSDVDMVPSSAMFTMVPSIGFE